MNKAVVTLAGIKALETHPRTAWCGVNDDAPMLVRDPIQVYQPPPIDFSGWRYPSRRQMRRWRWRTFLHFVSLGLVTRTPRPEARHVRMRVPATRSPSELTVAFLDAESALACFVQRRDTFRLTFSNDDGAITYAIPRAAVKEVSTDESGLDGGGVARVVFLVCEPVS